MKSKRGAGGETGNCRGSENMLTLDIRTIIEKVQSECKASNYSDYVHFYSLAFVNIMKLLHYCLNSLQNGNIVNTGPSNMVMYPIFYEDANPHSTVFPNQDAEQKVQTVIEKCFTLLKEMMEKSEINQYLFQRIDYESIELRKALDTLVKKYNDKLNQRYDIKTNDYNFKKKMANNIPTLRDKYDFDDKTKYSHTSNLIALQPTKNDELRIHVEALKKDFSDFMETYGDAIRVYVRIKGGDPLANEGRDSTPGLSYNNSNIVCGPSKIEYSTESFANVFDKTYTTEQVYNELNKDDIFGRVLNGYNTVIFGYGYSGSGKTFTLLKENEGLLYKLLNDPEFKQRATISLHNVFELNDDGAGPLGGTTKTDLQCIGTCIQYFGNTKIEDDPLEEEATLEKKLLILLMQLTGSNKAALETELANNDNVNITKGLFQTISDNDGERRKNPRHELVNNVLKNKLIENAMTLLKNQALSSDNSDPAYIEAFLNYIDIHRRFYMRIHQTPNNSESSRGHLFIVLKVQDNSKTIKPSYITFVDMAGREDPIDIIRNLDNSRNYGDYEMYKTRTDSKGFAQSGKTLSQIIGESLKISKSKTTESKLEANSRMALLESFYINETINHMKFFFLRRLYKNELQPPPVQITYPDVFNKQATYKPDMVMYYPEQLFYKNKNDLQQVAPTPKTQVVGDKKNLAITEYDNINLEQSVTGKTIFLFTPEHTFYGQWPKLAKIANDKSHNMNVNKAFPATNTVNTSSVPNGSLLAKNINTYHNKYNQGLDKVKMIPYLQKLENLGGNPTKFVMICCVRREEKYCSDVAKTLQFAKEISSNNALADKSNSVVSFIEA